ncbi:SIMPL domain-containing protein [Streptomyces sp. NPDC091271]|uniref:SIMPL domain-containing protein n=1 Tax=Streptomyces sp. NPDC091271 TaxID=3365980 RepID=UPI0037F53A57
MCSGRIPNGVGCAGLPLSRPVRWHVSRGVVRCGWAGLRAKRELRSRARTAAVAAAREKAALYAEAAGAQLGPVIHITRHGDRLGGGRPSASHSSAAEDTRAESTRTCARPSAGLPRGPALAHFPRRIRSVFPSMEAVRKFRHTASTSFAMPELDDRSIREVDPTWPIGSPVHAGGMDNCPQMSGCSLGNISEI